MGIYLNEPVDPDEVLAMLSVAKMKESLRISYTKEDGFIRDCILEAYDWLVKWLNRGVIDTAYTLTMDSFPSSFGFPVTPVSAVTSIKYLVSGTPVTVSPSVYYLNKQFNYGHGLVNLQTDQVWPTDGDTTPESVSVVFTTGLGSGEDVAAAHPSLVRGLKTLSGDFFRNREDTFVDIRMVEIDRRIINDVKRTCGRYKIYNKIT